MQTGQLKSIDIERFSLAKIDLEITNNEHPCNARNLSNW